MEELVTGIVMENWDEDHKNMVKVEYYLGEAGLMQTNWMPVMTPYAGPEYGLYLFPEVGAEVVVGFRFGDKDRPFVMGCIMGVVNTVPEENATENNTMRILKTKAGFQVSVDEENNIVSCKDPEGENAVTWSVEKDHGTLTLDIKEKLEILLGGEAFMTVEEEKVTFAGKVTIYAEEMVLETEKAMEIKSGKEMTIGSSEGLKAKSANAMELEAGQTLTQKGQNVEISPTQGLTVAGMKAEIAPTQELSLSALQLKMEGTTAALSGKASVKLEASGMMEVKGAMLKLN